MSGKIKIHFLGAAETVTGSKYLVDTVLPTHGHLDHVDYMPRLVKMGFKGKIRGTAPSLDIAAIILKDSVKIQEEEAERTRGRKLLDGENKRQLPLEPGDSFLVRDL